MSNRRTLMAAAAIVLAFVAGIGVYLYASGADKRAQDNASFVDALVANSDIAKGTTGAEVIQAGLVTKEKVAKGSVPASVVTNIDDLTDRVAAGPIDAKQFITQGSWVSSANGVGGPFSQSIASQDLVAVTVTVDADHGVANQITPGDHVNIATTTTDAEGNAQTTYLMNNVKVLAVGASTAQQQAAAAAQPAADGSAPEQTSGVLTFEVSQDDALRVIAANSGSSKLYLVLLPPASTSTPTPSSGNAEATASSK